MEINVKKKGIYLTIGSLVAGLVIAVPGMIDTYKLTANSPDGVSVLGPMVYLGSILIVTLLCVFHWLTEFREDPWIPSVTWFIGQCIVFAMNGLGIFRVIARWADSLPMLSAQPASAQAFQLEIQYPRFFWATFSIFLAAIALIVLSFLTILSAANTDSWVSKVSKWVPRASSVFIFIGAIANVYFLCVDPLFVNFWNSLYLLIASVCLMFSVMLWRFGLVID